MLHRVAWIRRTVAAAIVVFAGVAVSGALARGGPGNGPKLPVKEPTKKALPAGKPLIVLRFNHRKLIGLTGTALLPGATLKPKKGAPKATQSASCSVNFTHTTKVSAGKTMADWFGGIGCSRSMFLFGTAYLQESATKVDGSGNHYQLTAKSASSGQSATVINDPHPSLYIRHLTNVYFPIGTGSGQISVYPAKGEILNSASKCVKATFGKYGLGVHCDLYTNRF
jgi:hypothetical protein